jgi:hypothetical protein
MNSPLDAPATAFEGHRLLCAGPLSQVALAVHAGRDAHPPVLVLDDQSGRPIDLDLRGSADEVLARLGPPAGDAPGSAEPRGRGRPRLGVVAREVTLLPRHWDWLSQQPGGASVALRKLVEEARRANADQDHRRQVTDAAFRALSALAGDLPGFEEATRALFAHDAAGFARSITPWPDDVRRYALRMSGIDAASQVAG